MSGEILNVLMMDQLRRQDAQKGHVLGFPCGGRLGAADFLRQPGHFCRVETAGPFDSLFRQQLVNVV